MRAERDNPRILAIDPTTKGLAFAVLDEDGMLLDWGTMQVRGNKNKETLRRIEGLMTQYEPDCLVTEVTEKAKTRRCLRVRELLRAARRSAARHEVETVRISREDMRRALAPARTKYEIAQAIGRMFPELQSRLPRFRKPWMTEDERMGIFDAVGMALAANPTRAEEEIAAA